MNRKVKKEPSRVAARNGQREQKMTWLLYHGKDEISMLKAQLIVFFARLLEGLGMVLAYVLAAAFAGAVILLIVCIIAEMDKEAKKNG